MVIQKYEVQNGNWYIQNVGIEQAFRNREIPLDIDKAEDWFTALVKSKLEVSSQTVNFSKSTRPQKLRSKYSQKLTKYF